MGFTDEMGFDEATKFATDCYVETEYQLSLMDYWMGNNSYDGSPLNLDYVKNESLNDDTVEDLRDDLSNKVQMYEDFVDNINDLLSAANDTLSGLRRSLIRANDFETTEKGN